MPLRRIGVPIAIVVFLYALARISSVAVEWAWFSSIGYVGVFWTAFATKAALFEVIFAVSTVLLWGNATLALRFASRPRLRVPAGPLPNRPHVDDLANRLDRRREKDGERGSKPTRIVRSSF